MSVSCWTHIQNQIYPIIWNSGRVIGRLGNYNGCLQTQGMEFNYVFTGYEDAAFPGIGLCLPKQCTSQSIKNILQVIFKKSNIPFKILQVQNGIQDITYPYTFSFYLTTFILLSLILLVLISSISKSFRNHKILSAFSLQNSLKIFKYHDNQLNTLNGVRSLAMMWVIFGHEYSFMIGTASNILTIDNRLQSWFFVLVQSGLYSVDTFFFIGGFLVSYAVLKQTSQSPLKYPLAILNRFLRLVPSYFMAMMILYSIVIHLGSGPMWSITESQINACQNIWYPLLFVQNIFQNLEEYCLGWGWYLQNDMQLFIYSLLILMIYHKSKSGAYLMIFWSILISFAYVMTETYNNKYRFIIHLTDGADNAAYMNNIYVKPWCRCPPYLYGILLGMLYSNFLSEEKKEESNHIFVRIKRKCTRSRLFRYSIEFCGLLISLFVILIIRTGQNEHFWSQLANSLYLTYAKVTFVVGLSLILLPSLLGVDSIIRFMMDTKFFNFVAKVSYCTYLVHVIIIMQFQFSRTYDYYLTPITLYPIFIAHTTVAIFLGFTLSVVVQIPFSKLQKLLMGFLIKKSKAQKNMQQREDKEKSVQYLQQKSNLNQNVK